MSWYLSVSPATSDSSERMKTRVPSVDAPAKYALVATVSLPPGETIVTVPPELMYTSFWLSRSTGRCDQPLRASR